MSWRRLVILGLILAVIIAIPAYIAGKRAAVPNDCAQLGKADASDSGDLCANPAAEATETGAARVERPAGTRKARVRRIYDGDTILVSIGHDSFTVRIMGMDTPEEFDPDVPVECFAAEASARTAQLIPEGTLIYLDRDITDFDRFGRTLRYVWYIDGDGRYRLLEDSMIREGYAVLSVFRPNLKYVHLLAEAQARAQESGLGLWGACGGADTPLGAPSPTPTPVPAKPPLCDPAYPGVCIPPISEFGDLDCRDVIYRWFVVLPPDPHRFDVDGDGYGCQS